MSIDLSDPLVIQTVDEFYGPKLHSWLILSYSAQRDKLVLTKAGSGGIVDLQTNLDKVDQDVAYALFREGRMITYITYVGQTIGGVKRARATIHGRLVGSHLFDPHHIEFMVSSSSEITRDRLARDPNLAPPLSTNFSNINIHNAHPVSQGSSSGPVNTIQAQKQERVQDPVTSLLSTKVSDPSHTSQPKPIETKPPLPVKALSPPTITSSSSSAVQPADVSKENDNPVSRLRSSHKGYSSDSSVQSPPSSPKEHSSSVRFSRPSIPLFSNLSILGRKGKGRSTSSNERSPSLDGQSGSVFDTITPPPVPPKDGVSKTLNLPIFSDTRVGSKTSQSNGVTDKNGTRSVSNGHRPLPGSSVQSLPPLPSSSASSTSDQPIESAFHQTILRRLSTQLNRPSENAGLGLGMRTSSNQDPASTDSVLSCTYEDAYDEGENWSSLKNFMTQSPENHDDHDHDQQVHEIILDNTPTEIRPISYYDRPKYPTSLTVSSTAIPQAPSNRSASAPASSSLAEATAMMTTPKKASERQEGQSQKTFYTSQSPILRDSFVTFDKYRLRAQADLDEDREVVKKEEERQKERRNSFGRLRGTSGGWLMDQEQRRREVDRDLIERAQSLVEPSSRRTRQEDEIRERRRLKEQEQQRIEIARREEEAANRLKSARERTLAIEEAERRHRKDEEQRKRNEHALLQTEEIETLNRIQKELKIARSSGGVVADGWLTVQAPETLIFRRRFFHILPFQLLIFKDSNDVSRPLNTIALPSADHLHISDAYEEIQVLHSFRLEDKSETTWLFYLDSEGDKTVVIEAIKVAAS
ncbi:Pleckstrin homology-like domain [Phaffia rhodozyma]|uniref:Pleckstrin homology-like domain n=1 Tax=Phaffia rhodozyma TaxID=264483 RepID=A0A0F7SG72_PHARH|nr:Pleckstrin homology-like domain [Phaffia rhodozyma]